MVFFKFNKHDFESNQMLQSLLTTADSVCSSTLVQDLWSVISCGRGVGFLCLIDSKGSGSPVGSGPSAYLFLAVYSDWLHKDI